MVSGEKTVILVRLEPELKLDTIEFLPRVTLWSGLMPAALWLISF